MSQDCCSQPGLMLPADALARMREQVSPLQAEEWVDLTQCMGRVLAQDIAATTDLPPFDNSAMDGYAVRAADVYDGAVLTLAGKAFAGMPYTGDCEVGQCVRIMTGAALPPMLDSIVMQEVVIAEGEQIRFTEAVREGHFVRRRGSELSAGTVVLKAGTKIGAAEIGVLATVGIAKAPVRTKLKVALFSTGDELKAPGTKLAEGEIYDSNRHALRAMLEAMGCDVLDLGVIPDDLEQVRAAFAQADAQADLVITSGGVSVGEADFIKVVLDELGQISFWKLAIKPGKPFAFGRLPNAWFCGLPGNPVSSMVTCYQLVQPLIAHLAGEPAKTALTFNATLLDSLRKAPGRQEYQRGILSRADDGSLQVLSTGAQGSDMTSSMSRANCFIILSREQGDTPAGTQVTVEPFNQVLGGL